MAILPDRFKKKPALMPPPGEKPKAVIAIGIGPKKAPGDDDDEPDDAAPDTADSSAPPAPASSAPGVPGGGDEPDEDDAGDVMTPDQAIVLRADDKTCQQCKNWSPNDGGCSVVPEGAPYDPGDRCLRGFQALDQEPADDSQGDEAMEANSSNAS